MERRSLDRLLEYRMEACVGRRDRRSVWSNMELGLASSTTHLSMRSRLSLAIVGKVEQRNRGESMGRILDNWVWVKLVMDWSQCRVKERKLLILTTTTAELTGSSFCTVPSSMNVLCNK